MDFLEYFSGQESSHKYEDHEVVAYYVSHPDDTVRKIAKEVGRSVPEIYRILHRHGKKPDRLKGGHSLVRDFADAGYSIPQIAELTGYTARNVRHILTRSGG